MGLTIELAEPEMTALTELARAEGRELGECASRILRDHLAPGTGELKRPQSTGHPVGASTSRSMRRNAHALAGKYRHVNVSTETLRQSRQEDLEIEEAKYAQRFENTGDSR